MSATGLDVFDKTLQTTNTWLAELTQDLGLDRQVAWHVLGAVLHTVRDRVPVDLAAHLGAQLPLLVRGLYYDQWHPAGQPERSRSLDEFLARVSDRLASTQPINAREAAGSVFALLNRHVTPGQVGKVRHALPEEVQALWPAAGMEAA